MHDLNTINRLNGEAFAASVENFRGQGRHVVARYEGSTLVAIETFSELAEAEAYLTEHDVPAERRAGTRHQLFKAHAVSDGEGSLPD